MAASFGSKHRFTIPPPDYNAVVVVVKTCLSIPCTVLNCDFLDECLSLKSYDKDGVGSLLHTHSSSIQGSERAVSKTVGIARKTGGASVLVVNTTRVWYKVRVESLGSGR